MSTKNESSTNVHDCLTDEEFIDFASDEALPVAARYRIEAHIEICELCAAELEGYFEDDFDGERWRGENEGFLADLRRRILLVEIAQSLTGRRLGGDLKEPGTRRPWDGMASGRVAVEAAAFAQAGSTRDGSLHWRVIEEGGGFRLRITSSDPQTAGGRFKISAGGAEDEIVLAPIDGAQIWMGETRVHPSGVVLTVDPA